MKNILFLITFCLSVTFGYSELAAQEIVKPIPQHTIDSLKTLIKNHPQDDQQKVIWLNEYAQNSFYNFDIINGFNAALEARELSRTIGFKGGLILYHLTVDKFLSWYERHTFHENKAKKLSLEKGQSQYFLKKKLLKGYPGYRNSQDKKRKAKIYEEALSYFTDKGNKGVQIEILSVLSDHTFWNYDKKVAAGYYARLSQLCEEFGQTYWSIYAKLGEVLSLQQIGDYEGMKNSFEGVLTKLSAISDLNQRANIFHRLGEYYSNNGQLAMAADYFTQSIEINKELNNRPRLANNYRLQSDLYSKLKMPLKAFEAAEKTIEFVKEGNESFLAQAYVKGFETSLTLKDYERAREYLNILEKYPESIVLKHLLFLNKALESQILLDADNFREAIPILEGIHAHLELNFRWLSFEFSQSIAQSYFQLGEYNKALTYALRSKKEFIEVNREDRDFKGLHKLLSEIYGALGQKNKAFDHLKSYHDIDDAQKLKENASEVLRLELQSILKSSNDKIKALDQERVEQQEANKLQRLWILSIAGALFSAMLISIILYRNNKNKQKANTVLSEQKDAIQQTLEKLKSTQNQLIQSEKMASLGELTAGIAHEIQNPLNFVNNFSELSEELIDEMNEELTSGNLEEATEISQDLKQNLSKISHHGKRASSIVIGMLEHSRKSTGEKVVTDLNSMVDEYLRLAYHGLRAKDSSFQCDFKMDLDEKLPKISVVPQDIGRVLLNLINNGFQVCGEKSKEQREGYKPELLVSTKSIKDNIEISIKDNGNGIPKEIKDKIFQPFFTTKPTGQGTGLGLSLSYDIVKAHGGELKVETKEGAGSIFIIKLPLT